MNYYKVSHTIPIANLYKNIYSSIYFHNISCVISLFYSESNTLGAETFASRKIRKIFAFP